MKDKLLMALWYVVLVLLGLYLLSLLVTKVVAKTTNQADRCTYSCPTYTNWAVSRLTCPTDISAFTWETKPHAFQCKWPEKIHGMNHWAYPVEEFFRIDSFTYGKSEDPTKCHRPTGESLGVPEWGMNQFNNDFDEWVDSIQTCVTPTCTPIPTLEPTTEPTTTPEPTEEPTPTEEVTPTPSIEVPTPTPTEAPALVRGATSPVKTESGTSIPSVNEPTQCQDTIPYKVTDFWIENPVSGDNALTLRWGTSQDWNTVNIAYGENKYEWKYALLGTEDDGEEVIRGLDNGTHYWFQIAFTNGCAVSEYTEPQDPLP